MAGLGLEQALAAGRSALAGGAGAGAGAGGAARTVLAVTGNDACDADSLVSAVGFAWWWAASAETRALRCDPVAIANVPRAELRLRRDAALLFERAGLSADALVCVDEAAEAVRDIAHEDVAARIALGLTDHNAVTDRIKAIFGEDVKVLGVADHHQDAGKHMDAPVRIVDEGCGSACTLVAEKILDEGEGLEVPDSLVQMLLGVMLLDTRDFDPDAKKFNDRDLRVYTALCDRFASIVPSREGQSLLYKDLIAARDDTEGFSASDLLRLDFKSAKLASGALEGSTVGFASIMDTAKGFVERATADGGTFDEALQTMMDDNDLEALFCLCKPVKVPEKGGKMKTVMMRARKEGTLAPLLTALDRLPEGLPDKLAANPLFGADVQDIVNQGFGILDDNELRTHAGLPADGLAAVCHVRRPITRKTLMPTIISFLEAV